MKQFTEKEIEQFKNELYEELIRRGESQDFAKAIASHLDDYGAAIGIIPYNTPKEYADLMTL